MDCIFCRIVKKQIQSDIIFEDEKTIAFLDIAPINKGHILIIPKTHSSQLVDADERDLDAMLHTLRKVVPAVIKAVNADGWNLGVNNGKAAGQVVHHTHWHIIPRFSGDGLKHWPSKSYAEGESKRLADDIKQIL